MEEQTVTTRSPPRTPAPAWTPFIQSVHPATLARPQRWEAVLSRCGRARVAGWTDWMNGVHAGAGVRGGERVVTVCSSMPVCSCLACWPVVHQHGCGSALDVGRRCHGPCP